MSRRYRDAKSFGGVLVRSRFEATVLTDLEMRDVEFEYEPFQLNWYDQVRSAACEACDGTEIWKERWYTPDLQIAGAQTLIEIKGKLTPDDCKTLLGVKEVHEGWRICILFQRDNWRTSKHVSRYSDWAAKHGFEWAVGESIPASWVTQSKE